MVEWGSHEARPPDWLAAHAPQEAGSIPGALEAETRHSGVTVVRRWARHRQAVRQEEGTRTDRRQQEIMAAKGERPGRGQGVGARPGCRGELDTAECASLAFDCNRPHSCQGRSAIADRVCCAPSCTIHACTTVPRRVKRSGGREGGRASGPRLAGAVSVATQQAVEASRRDGARGGGGRERCDVRIYDVSANSRRASGVGVEIYRFIVHAVPAPPGACGRGASSCSTYCLFLPDHHVLPRTRPCPYLAPSTPAHHLSPTTKDKPPPQVSPSRPRPSYLLLLRLRGPLPSAAPRTSTFRIPVPAVFHKYPARAPPHPRVVESVCCVRPPPRRTC